MQNWKLDPAEELKKKKAGQYDEVSNMGSRFLVMTRLKML